MFYSKNTGGFYTLDIHGSNMPEDVVEITEQEHQALLQAQATGMRIEGDNKGKPVAMPAQATLSELKVAKKYEMARYFTQSMQQITSGYPADEIASWGKQETEARAFSANATALTPLVDALSAARGVAKAELVTRIITKADLFATVSGQLIGKRQGLEDSIDSVTTKTALAAIVW